MPECRRLAGIDTIDLLPCTEACGRSSQTIMPVVPARKARRVCAIGRVYAPPAAWRRRQTSRFTRADLRKARRGRPAPRLPRRSTDDRANPGCSPVRGTTLFLFEQPCQSESVAVRPNLTLSPLVALFALAVASPAIAQNQTVLEKALEGREVMVLMDMPASHAGDATASANRATSGERVRFGRTATDSDWQGCSNKNNVVPWTGEQPGFVRSSVDLRRRSGAALPRPAFRCSA